jgi:DNA repair exonuclease SbcCD ATPase subunit
MIYVTGAMFLSMILMGGIGSWYYNDTQERIETLRENNSKLEYAVETSEQSINLLQRDVEKQIALSSKLQQELKKAEAYGDELRATLRKHNLTNLANKKPGLIEKKMNNATKKLWDDIVNDTTPKRVQSPTMEQQSGARDQGSNEN